MVTSAAVKELFDFYDRRPLVGTGSRPEVDDKGCVWQGVW